MSELPVVDGAAEGGEGVLLIPGAGDVEDQLDGVGGYPSGEPRRVAIGR
jgi:hypothetical protein